TALAHVREIPSPPRTHHGGIPGPLEAVVLKAMARDPADRYQTASDFGIALASADLDAGPASEDQDQPTPPAGVVRVPRGKRRWGPAILVLALVVLVAAVVLSQLPSVRSGRSGAPLS